MNRPQRNHNPGNLRFARQKEAIGEDGGFAVFSDDPAGWRALIGQIVLDQKRGLTISEFIIKYAPPNENQTGTYLVSVAKGLMAGLSDKLSDFSQYAIAGLIAAQEGYFERNKL